MEFTGNRRKAHALAHQELTFIDDSIGWESSFDNRLKMMLKYQELDSTSEPTLDPSSEPTTESNSEPTSDLTSEPTKHGREDKKARRANIIPDPTKRGPEEDKKAKKVGKVESEHVCSGVL